MCCILFAIPFLPDNLAETLDIRVTMHGLGFAHDVAKKQRYECNHAFTHACAQLGLRFQENFDCAHQYTQDSKLGESLSGHAPLRYGFYVSADWSLGT